METPTIRIAGVSKDAYLELRELLPPNSLSFEAQPLTEDTEGELFLGIAAIVATAAALKALVAWFATRGDSSKYELEIQTADGIIIRETQTTRRAPLESSDTDLLTRLSDLSPEIRALMGRSDPSAR